MIRREIGKTGRKVNAIGLGCMGMSAYYGAPMVEKEGAAQVALGWVLSRGENIVAMPGTTKRR